MSKKLIIGLTGAAGVGKSAFARELEVIYGFERMSLAQPLKLMLAGLLSTWGYNEAAIKFWIEGDGKERPCPALAYQTPRHAMQQLGTEFGRQRIGGEVWVNHLLKRIEASDATRIVIDDVRFDNEAEAIVQLLDGSMFRIIPAPGKGPKRQPGDHTSEYGVNPDLIDAMLVNDFTFEGVSEQVRALAPRWFF